MKRALFLKGVNKETFSRIKKNRKLSHLKYDEIWKIEFNSKISAKKKLQDSGYNQVEKN